MKSIEQLVAGIRELRFSMDRLTAAEIAEAQPAAKQALIAQAHALHADTGKLIEELGAQSDDKLHESELAGQ